MAVAGLARRCKRCLVYSTKLRSALYGAQEVGQIINIFSLVNELLKGVFAMFHRKKGRSSLRAACIVMIERA